MVWTDTKHAGATMAAMDVHMVLMMKFFFKMMRARAKLVNKRAVTRKKP